MGTEVAHVVDLRSLSQSELVALAAASPYAVDPHRGRDANVLPPPKIDRAVFNESAGSRKQTFSRHRVATNLSHHLSPATVSSSAAAAPAEEDFENRLIVFHLQRLFAHDDPSYPSPPPIPPQPQTLIVPTVTALAPAASSLPMPPPPDPDREVMNPHGVAVDLARLAELVDPYGDEMRKRTIGLGPESELLEFMNGLEGQWGSRRRRRKFVDAAMFGDHLPRGWKLLLGLKRKERAAWIFCRRYVSPKGHQFSTCREVSSFLMSLLGYPEAKPTDIQRNSAEVHDLSAVNSVGLHQQTDSTEEKQSAMPVTSVTLSSHSGDSQRQKPHKDEVQVEANANVHDLSAVNSAGLNQQTDSTEEKQNAMPVTSVTLSSHSGDSQRQKPHKDEVQVEANAKECRKCNLTFRDQGAYVQHQLSFHQRKAKRRKVSKSGELGVSKDGKCETQECQKTSEDRHGHVGHDVADVRSQGQSPGTLFDGPFSGVIGGQLSLAAAPSGFQEMTALPEQEREPSAQESDSGHHKDPLQELTDFPEVKKGHIVGEPVSGDYKDPVDNPDDHKTHYSACHNAGESLAVDVASKIGTCNDANVHKNDSSKDLEIPSADCSQNFIRPDETCSKLKEVPPTTDAPGESEYADDPMECIDITQSKQVSEPCDKLDGKFGIVPEENNFNNLAESNPLSAALGEPDLNSIGMEIDDGNIACKYGDVANPTSFENDKPVEDKIVDCGMTALKDDDIHSDARIRDVNLNSCLETISPPVSGAKYETSNAFDDANQSSIIVQCFGASSNDDNACEDEIFVNQNNASKAKNIVNQKNDMVYQSNLTMGPISPAQINVDCFTSSCSMTSEIKNNGNRCEDNSKEQLVNSQNISSNETGFDVEAYNNDIFNGTITESSLAQLNNAINMKTDFSSCYSLSDLNTLTGGTATDEIDIHGIRSSFVNGSTSRNEPNEHCTLDFTINGSMLEALEKSDGELENQYNGGDPACDSLPAPGTSGSIDDFLSMQTNFGSLTSLVRAVEDVPLSRIIQDQCDLQLGFGGQKQQMFPSFEQQLRMAAAGAPQFGGMSRHNSVPVPEPTLMLGYAPQLGSCPPVQLGWDLSLSKMVSGCVLQTVCVWCSSQFQHFGTVAEQQADSLGFICPACKEKISGNLSMLNNGSSQL